MDRGQSYPVRCGAKLVDLVSVHWNRNHPLPKLYLQSPHEKSHPNSNRKLVEHNQLGVWMGSLLLLSTASPSLAILR